MDIEKLSVFSVLTMKLALYQNKHNGKNPAKIFINTSAFLEITKTIKCVTKSSVSGEHKIYGIPVILFHDDGKEFCYLSDEEE